jgi:hypothetical protein
LIRKKAWAAFIIVCCIQVYSSPAITAYPLTALQDISVEFHDGKIAEFWDDNWIGRDSIIVTNANTGVSFKTALAPRGIVCYMKVTRLDQAIGVITLYFDSLSNDKIIADQNLVIYQENNMDITSSSTKLEISLFEKTADIIRYFLVDGSVEQAKTPLGADNIEFIGNESMVEIECLIPFPVALIQTPVLLSQIKYAFNIGLDGEEFIAWSTNWGMALSYQGPSSVNNSKVFTKAVQTRGSHFDLLGKRMEVTRLNHLKFKFLQTK